MKRKELLVDNTHHSYYYYSTATHQFPACVPRDVRKENDPEVCREKDQ
jgi:hypothetical protein